jgi:hypothetical protein
MLLCFMGKRKYTALVKSRVSRTTVVRFDRASIYAVLGKNAVSISNMHARSRIKPGFFGVIQA